MSFRAMSPVTIFPGSRSAIPVLLYILVASASAAVASPPNAADHYHRAFDSMRTLYTGDASQRIWELIQHPTRPIDPQTRRLLEQSRSITDALRQGARLQHVDFHVDPSDGPMVLLPHLSPMRSSMHLLMAEAHLRLQDGDARAAATNFDTALRMANHVTADGFLINSLVGVAMTASTIGNGIQNAIDRGLIGADESRMLLESVRGFDRSELFGVPASLENERIHMTDWLRRAWDSRHENGDAHEFMNMLLSDDIGGTILDQMDDVTFLGLVSGYEEATARLAAATSLNDLVLAREEIERIEKDVTDGLYGDLAQVLVGAIGRVFDSAVTVLEQLDDLETTLAFIIENPERAADLRNAAVLYLDAIDQRTLIDAADWHRLRHGAVDEVEVESTEVVAARMIEQAGPIFALLEEAATYRLCRFDVTNNWLRSGMFIRLDHLAGMHDLARLVALRLQSREDARDRAEDVTLLLAMSAHVGMDARPASSELARTIFELAEPHLSKLGAISSLEESPRDRLQFAARLHEPGDPFGQARALRGYRAHTTEWLLGRTMSNPGNLSNTLTGLPMVDNELGPQITAELADLADHQIQDRMKTLDTFIADLISAGTGGGNVSLTSVRERLERSPLREMPMIVELLAQPVEVMLAALSQDRERIQRMRHQLYRPE